MAFRDEWENRIRQKDRQCGTVCKSIESSKIQVSRVEK